MGIGSLLGVLGSGSAANQALEQAAQIQQEQMLFRQFVGAAGGGILGAGIMGGMSGGFGGGMGMIGMLPLLGILPMLLTLFSELQGGQQGQGIQGSGYPSSYPPPGYSPSSNYGNGGTLSQQSQGSGNQVTTYTDHNGWKVTVNPNKGSGYPTVTITSPDGKRTITEEGDPHESGAQGAQSDWKAKDRTIELPDGTVINLSANAASGSNGGIQGVNIFDGREEVNINAQNGSVTNADFNGYKTSQDESTLPTDNIARAGWQNGQFSLISEQQAFNPYSQIPRQPFYNGYPLYQNDGLMQSQGYTKGRVLPIVGPGGQLIGYSQEYNPPG